MSRSVSVITTIGLRGLVLFLGGSAIALYIISTLWVKGDAIELVADRMPGAMALARQADSPPAVAAFRRELVEIASSAQHEKTAHEIVLHVSIAFFVAALLLALVEIRVKRVHELEMAEYKADMAEKMEKHQAEMAAKTSEYQKAISENVWNAVSGQKLPREVVTEINWMLGFDTVRRECTYRFTFDVAPEIEGHDSRKMVLVRRQLSYTIERLASRGVVHHRVRSRFDGLSRKVAKRTGNRYPCYARAVFNGVPEEFEGDPHPISVDKELIIGDKPATVVLEAEEIYSMEDHLVYAVKTPVIGVSVDIINNLRDRLRITAVSLTGNDEDRELVPAWPDENGIWAECKWKYPGAILPGQGFSITFRELTPEERQKESSCRGEHSAPAAAQRPQEENQPSVPPPPATTLNA